MQGDQSTTTHLPSGGNARSPRGLRPLSRATALVLALATTLDLAGRTLDVPILWRSGAHLITVGTVAGGLAWLASLVLVDPVRGRRGLVLWFFALVCFALARWVRGSAGVPPDPPLQALEIIGVLLLAGAYWRGARQRR